MPKLEKLEHDDDETLEDDPEARRMTRSLAGLAVILLLAVIGLFLAQKLRAVSTLEDCLMSGRTNCATLAPSQ
ncbi:MAG TPA: hypothetical protein VKY65_21110 [Alphaproteobacteria bacterium]|nr:hypothetical protein [Alphaproteobacteria bacterium]